MKKIFKIGFISIFFAILISCSLSDKKLPILGERSFVNGDSVYHTIPNFEFTNQDNEKVTNKTFENKIYITDFFFTTCPTICPIMKTQMLRVYDKYKSNSEIGILSHSIDPRHDSVAVLKKYATKLGVDTKKWHFVTGEKKKIYDIGQNFYMVTSGEDSTAEGGYIHSGAFILVDKKRRIRGMYDGTKEKEVSKLLKDIDILLQEK